MSEEKDIVSNTEESVQQPAKKALKTKPKKWSYRLFLKSGDIFDGYEETNEYGGLIKDYIIGDSHEWGQGDNSHFKISNDGEVTLAISNSIFGGFHRIEVVKN